MKRSILAVTVALALHQSVGALSIKKLEDEISIPVDHGEIAAVQVSRLRSFVDRLSGKCIESLGNQLFDDRVFIVKEISDSGGSPIEVKINMENRVISLLVEYGLPRSRIYVIPNSKEISNGPVTPAASVPKDSTAIEISFFCTPKS